MIYIVLFIYLLATCRVVFIKNLEKEDWRLLNESDSDASNFIYHEKMRPDVQQEVWDMRLLMKTSLKDRVNYLQLMFLKHLE